MRKSLFIMACVLVILFGSVFIPSVNAETFKIGKKVSEGDFPVYAFSSGVVVETDPEYIDYVSLIFDGNNSTGINNNFNNGEDKFRIQLNFDCYVNINSIIVKPHFGGGVSDYQLGVSVASNFHSLEDRSSDEKIFYVNSSIKEISLRIYDKNYGSGNETGYFCFNDVIINYTPSSNNHNDMQSQINKINQDILTINNNMVNLKNDINNIKDNITNIKNNMPIVYNDSALQDKINNLKTELDSLKKNLSELENNLNSNQTNSGLKGRVVNLEAENVILNQKIGNLTLKLENLTTELEKLESEVQNLGQKSGDGNGNGEQESSLSQYSSNILLGIIVIILLLIILKLTLTIYKRKHREMEDLEPDDVLMNNIRHEMQTNNKMKSSRLYDDESKLMLETKYRKGEMSEETYNYIKKVLEVPNESHDIKGKNS